MAAHDASLRRRAGEAGQPVQLVGTQVPRLDIPDKVSGEFTYVHNIRVPGMLHGRLVRPRGQGAYGDGTKPAILSVDEGSIKHIPARASCAAATSSGSSRRRVRRDPGGGAAEGEVGGPAAICGQREPLEADARASTPRARRRRASR